MADAVEMLDLDAEIRAIVLSSEGRAFCAGADLAGDATIGGSDGMQAVAALYRQASRLFRRRKPIVAAVQGAAVGAGLGLAVAADFRVAAPAARFSANFVALGFHPGFGLTQSLPQLIGLQRARWMMLTGDRVRPETALEWGLIDRLVPDEQLIDAAGQMAATIAANAPLALLATRRTLEAGMADRLEQAMRIEHAEQSELKGTFDHAEGVAAVFGRRPPRFESR